MKVSLNIIRQFIDFELPPVDELVERINQQLGGVEEVIDLGDKYKDAVIVRVVECEKHPNADKLSVCQIDVGDYSLASNIQRLDSGLIQVVCGAPNVHAGMWAVWLPPGATVPASYVDKDPFVLDVRDIRGVKSNGMLAAADELAIGSDHAGIVELTQADIPPKSIHQLADQNLKPGQNFAAVFGLDDVIIDIENKMFTHRPDLFGQLGVAREIAGILGQKFTSPEWYLEQTARPQDRKTEDELRLIVENNAGEAVPRFMAVAIKEVTVRPSPFWLQCELVRLGGKPINNIVDVTNYVMLLAAQPVHAYDYDKLRANSKPSYELRVTSHEKFLGTRMARKGEKVTLLNGKTYELDETDIVIVDGEGPVGLGGIMGGGNSEVSDTTKNIVLEVANFDMYTVRRSSMKYGLFTDALTRFTKGQSPLQNPVVMNLLMMSVIDVAGGAQASRIFDEVKNELRGTSHEIEITDEFINSRLGVNLKPSEIIELLENVECEVAPRDTCLVTRAPFWRMDLEQPEDIVEEVGRLYGFDKLPRELPRRSIKPAPRNVLRDIKQRIRESLATAGANEVLTYSFVHENVMKRAGQNPEYAYRLSNALSPDLQYYRMSLTPSLLGHVHMNIKAGHDAFALFEIGKTHFKGEMDAAEPDVPNEDNHVALVIAMSDKQKPSGSAYYHARRYLGCIVDPAQLQLVPLHEFDVTADAWGAQLTSAYEPHRSAVIVKDDQIWGVVGEFTAAAVRAYKLPAYAAGFEIYLDMVADAAAPTYKKLSKYPSVTQDVSITVAHDARYGDVYRTVYESIAAQTSRCTYSLQPVSLYQATDDALHKTISLRLKIASYDETLTDKDVAALLSRAADSV